MKNVKYIENIQNNMNEKIIFKKNGIETTEIVNTPLTKPERRATIIDYKKIDELNPLDLHVIGINPIVRDNVLIEIELVLGAESSSYHSVEWFKEKVKGVLSDKTTFKKDDIYDKISKEFTSSDYKKLGSGGTRGYSNLTTALNQLKQEGVVENPRKGYWRKK
ncbi:MAG: hypothetical protein QXU18_14515 [Thermoplasmatales archaeon]